MFEQVYHRALILNEDCESKYALDYIQKFLNEEWVPSIPRTGRNNIEQTLLDLFRT
jgi:hypothetical protein